MSSLNLNRRDLVCFTAATAAVGLFEAPHRVAAQTPSTAGEPASPSTLGFNKNSTASLPCSDKADFANALKEDGYRQLAAEEAELASSAATNESRAQHYAMADYYTRLAEAQKRLPRIQAALARKAKR